MKILTHLFNHLLLPGYSNNQKAKLLHSESILVLVLLLISGQLFLKYFSHIGVQILGYASQISTDEVIRLTNEKRLSAGVSGLQLNPLLSAAAKSKGEDMLAKDYWAHVAPDGTQPWKFFTDVGYKYRYAGENLAKDFSNPSSAVEAWMSSPSHKENLLSSKYDEIGIAVVEGDLNGVDTTIIVQLFGKRYDTSIASVTTNVSAKDELPVKEALPTIQITPTSAPIPSPSPTVSFSNKDSVEVVQNSKAFGSPTPFQVLISPFSTKKGFSAAATSVLLITFAIDSVYLAKRKVARVGGRTFAHLLFLGMILIIVILVQSGELLPPVADTIK